VVVVIPGTAEAVGQHAEVPRDQRDGRRAAVHRGEGGCLGVADRYHFDWVMGALASGWRGAHPCGLGSRRQNPAVDRRAKGKVRAPYFDGATDASGSCHAAGQSAWALRDPPARALAAGPPSSEPG